MNLYNEYENKNILFFLNYINQISLGAIDVMSEEHLTELLTGGSKQLTYPELVASVANQSDGATDDLNLLYKDRGGYMCPVMSSPSGLPILLTKAEKSWLKYALSDNKADLFLSPEELEELSFLLKSENLPIKEEYVDTRYLNGTPSKYSHDYIHVFKKLMEHIASQALVEIKSACGFITVFPYKIGYDISLDEFKLWSYNIKTEEIEITPVEEILYVGPATYLSLEKEDYVSITNAKLQEHLVKTPITLKVFSEDQKPFSTSGNMAPDRAVHLFSSYNTLNHFDEEKNLIMEITYYDFQYEQVIQKILSLGRYVKVLSPSNVVNDIISMLAFDNYK